MAAVAWRAPLPPPDPAPAIRPSCPPPRTDAPTNVFPDFARPVHWLKPSLTDAGWIAARSGKRLLVSYDAGMTFEPTLDDYAPVEDASFDCFGRLIALRGNHVGVRDATGEHWYEVPMLRDTDDNAGFVFGGGPDVVVGARAAGAGDHIQIAVSRDGGATWEGHDLPGHHDADSSLRGRQWEDGRIDAVTSGKHDAAQTLVWTTIDGAHSTTTTETLEPFDRFEIYDHLLVAEGGWKKRGGPWHLFDRYALWILPGAVPVLVFIGPTEAARLIDGKLRPVNVDLDGEAFIADPAGRIWERRCGAVQVAQPTPGHHLPAWCDD